MRITGLIQKTMGRFRQLFGRKSNRVDRVVITTGELTAKNDIHRKMTAEENDRLKQLTDRASKEYASSLRYLAER